MSVASVFINGREYMSATDAGMSLGYTKDYMLMLTKQGKIDGQKIGNKWFIFLPSAEAYFEKAKSLNEERLRKLSEERKNELLRSMSSSDVKKSLITYSSTIDERKFTSVRHARVVFFEVLAIVFLGISVGSLGYVGYQAPASVRTAEGDVFLKYIANDVYNFFTLDSESQAALHASNSGGTPPVMSDVKDYTAFNTTQTKQKSIIVAPTDTFSTSTISSIQESFSDEVHVTFDPGNQNAGVITPKFLDAEDGETYRFIMVPVNAQKP